MKKTKRVWKMTPGTKNLKSMRLSKGNIQWWGKQRKAFGWSDEEMMLHVRRATGDHALLLKETAGKTKGAK